MVKSSFSKLNNNTQLMAPYRILSLDGGGCRAIIESTVLARLLETHPKLLEDVDLFAGTSAGSILALCFAAGFSNSETSEFYQTDVKEVFKVALMREFEVCFFSPAPHFHSHPILTPGFVLLTTPHPHSTLRITRKVN